ncbi:SAM-dependent methyltransferase, partial [Oleiphilus sp. HI0061]
MTVYFIGAGPGDPELMTLKGQRILERCPVVLYAGSLIPREVLDSVEDKAELIVDTASIDLEEISQHIEKAHQEGKDVARLQCGDPSLYGAIGEQIRRLEQAGIDY